MCVRRRAVLSCPRPTREARPCDAAAFGPISRAESSSRSRRARSAPALVWHSPTPRARLRRRQLRAPTRQRSRSNLRARAAPRSERRSRSVPRPAPPRSHRMQRSASKRASGPCRPCASRLRPAQASRVRSPPVGSSGCRPAISPSPRRTASTRPWRRPDSPPSRRRRSRRSHPSGSSSATIFPNSSLSVGVAQPIVIRFNHYVTSAVARASVEHRFTITESIPVAGGWHWFSNLELHFRPQSLWPTGEQVSVAADFDGWDAGNGLWGAGQTQRELQHRRRARSRPPTSRPTR